MHGIVKIKRFIKTGTLTNIDDVVDSGDLAIRAAGAMILSNAEGCIGEILFEGEDGNFYNVTLRAVIDQVHPDYVNNLETEDGNT